MSARGVSRHPRRRRHRGRGQALVEFAIIVPAFMLVLAGILDFGFLLNARISIVNATREAARWAVVQKDILTIPTNAGGTGLTQPGGKVGTLAGVQWSTLKSVQLFCTHTTFDDCDFVAGAKPNAVKGDSIQVRVTYYYYSFFARLFGTRIEMGSQNQMVLEVPTT